jgi:hypothetical protein
MRTVPEVTMSQTSRFGSQRLYRDAGSMATSSVANAVLGIAFCALAAKMFPPEKLGIMTAVLAVIMSVGGLVSTGVGDAYTALLPAVGTDRPHLYKRGQRLFFGLAVVGGIATAICATSWLRAVHGSLAVGAMVAVGTVVWATASLQNATLAALGRARWMPAVNVALSLGKIALLAVLATTLRWHPVELSAVIAAAVVMLMMQRANSSAKNGLPPDISAIRTIGGRENVRPSRVEINACNPPRLERTNADPVQQARGGQNACPARSQPAEQIGSCTSAPMSPTSRGVTAPTWFARGMCAYRRLFVARLRWRWPVSCRRRREVAGPPRWFANRTICRTGLTSANLA